MLKHVQKIIGRSVLIGLAIGISLMQINAAHARIIFKNEFLIEDNGANAFIIDADDDVTGSLILQFGGSLAESITFDTGNTWFSFSDDINVTGGVTASGTVESAGITSTGVLDFSGASRMALDQGASNPGTCTEGDIHYNTTNNTTYVCTVTDTWTALAGGGGGTDLQGTYDLDASGAHEIVVEAGGTNPLEILANANGDDLLQLENSGGSNLINFQDLGGTTIDIDSVIVDWDATGAFNLDSTTLSIDSTDTTNLTMSANDAGDKVMTISATNAGAGDGLIDIGTSTWNISQAGLATGFTGITSTGNIDFTATTSFRMHQAASDPATCNEGQTYYNTTDNTIRVCIATNTWTYVSTSALNITETAHVVKSATESEASTTVQADDELVFSVDANEVWIATFSIQMDASSSNTDFDFNFSVPTGARCDYNYSLLTAPSGGSDAINNDCTTEHEVNANAGSGTAPSPLLIQLALTNGANAGTVSLQWAANGTGTAYVLRGSMLEASRIQ